MRSWIPEERSKIFAGIRGIAARQDIVSTPWTPSSETGKDYAPPKNVIPLD